jgi:hypothetical protein
MPADPIDLDHLRRLLASATPGLWETARDPYRVHDAEGEAIADTWSPSDAALIAALRNAAPTLIDEVERLRAEVARIREAADVAPEDDLAWVVVRKLDEAENVGADMAAAWGALGPNAEGATLAEASRRAVASAREEGRAEERAAIVRWLRAEDYGYAPDEIERGKHREEADNA